MTRTMLFLAGMGAARVLAQAPALCEQPIIPPAVEGTPVVQAEHDWLRKTYGGGTPVRQLLGTSSDGKRRYDVIVWRKPDGQMVEVCFDVTTVFEDTIRRVEEEEMGDTRRPAR